MGHILKVAFLDCIFKNH